MNQLSNCSCNQLQFYHIRCWFCSGTILCSYCLSQILYVLKSVCSRTRVDQLLFHHLRCWLLRLKDSVLYVNQTSCVQLQGLSALYSSNLETQIISTNEGINDSFYCLDLAVYFDTSLEQTGEALVDHSVSCTSLLTAAEMLACNNIARPFPQQIFVMNMNETNPMLTYLLYIIHSAALKAAKSMHHVATQKENTDTDIARSAQTVIATLIRTSSCDTMVLPMLHLKILPFSILCKSLLARTRWVPVCSAFLHHTYVLVNTVLCDPDNALVPCVAWNSIKQCSAVSCCKVLENTVHPYALSVLDASPRGTWLGKIHCFATPNWDR